jgi:hypothetical protein
VAFLALAAAVIVLFPAYLDNRWRRENAMKNCLPLGMTLDSKFCDSGFRTDGRTLDRFPVITAREKLLELGASWDRGVLRDGSGKQIYLVRVPQYGNRPSDWEERRKKSFYPEGVSDERHHVVKTYETRGPQ